MAVSDSHAEDLTYEHLPAGFLERMAEAGALAPSGDNLQPWKFAAQGERLLVHHDPCRDRSLFNVRYSASFIALGAALENISLAASAQGYFSHIDFFPEADDSDLIAGVNFVRSAIADPLHRYLRDRCTNRRPCSKASLKPEVLTSIEASKNYPDIQLAWIHGNKLRVLAPILALADRQIFENCLIHEHLFSTIRWTRDEVKRTRDGLPVQALELGRAGALAFRQLRHWPVVRLLNGFGFSRLAAGHSAALMIHSAAAGLLIGRDPSPRGFLDAGRAFQRVWLGATQAGLAFQPMTAAIFLQLRLRFGDLDGWTPAQIEVLKRLESRFNEFFGLSAEQIPVMLFRVGFAAAPSMRTVRRPSFEIFST